MRKQFYDLINTKKYAFAFENSSIRVSDRRKKKKTMKEKYGDEALLYISDDDEQDWELAQAKDNFEPNSYDQHLLQCTRALVLRESCATKNEKGQFFVNGPLNRFRTAPFKVEGERFDSVNSYVQHVLNKFDRRINLNITQENLEIQNFQLSPTGDDITEMLVENRRENDQDLEFRPEEREKLIFNKEFLLGCRLRTMEKAYYEAFFAKWEQEKKQSCESELEKVLMIKQTRPFRYIYHVQPRSSYSSVFEEFLASKNPLVKRESFDDRSFENRLSFRRHPTVEVLKKTDLDKDSIDKNALGKALMRLKDTMLGRNNCQMELKRKSAPIISQWVSDAPPPDMPRKRPRRTPRRIQSDVPRPRQTRSQSRQRQPSPQQNVQQQQQSPPRQNVSMNPPSPSSSSSSSSSFSPQQQQPQQQQSTPQKSIVLGFFQKLLSPLKKYKP